MLYEVITGWLDFLAEEIAPETYLNVMDQYRPCGQAHAYPDLCNRPSADEAEAARRAAKGPGLRLDDRHERQAMWFMRRLRNNFV